MSTAPVAEPTAAAGPMPGQPIPIPPDFPVVWETPADAQGFWTSDRMHFPDPITPLFDDLIRILYQGFSQAAVGYDMPVRADARRFATYHFAKMAPLPLSMEEMERLGHSSEQKFGVAMAQLENLWNNEWLPAIKQHLAFYEELDLESATQEQIIRHFAAGLEHQKALWHLHFQIVFSSYLAVSIFEDMYRDIFSGEDGFDPHRLLQGYDNMTVKSGRALWTLSRRALTIPVVRRILEEEATTKVMPALQASPEGRAFLADFQSYLTEYGQRGDNWDVAGPSWIEQPTAAIKNLKDYVGQPDRDWDAERAAMVAEREAHVAQARERLQGYPQEVVGQFEFFLKAAQTGVVLTEDHNFWIDFRGIYQMRRLVLALGERLVAAGIIASRDDVFYLTSAEILEMPARRRGHQSHVAQRKAEMAHFAGIKVPPALGILPAAPPPDNPMTRFIMKFFGAPVAPSSNADEVTGHAGSPGVVRGVARVVRSLADAGRLQKGEILVAETTAPPWTPIFATAAAVVTDTGGILSHSAVVAREYGIPAVVGTGIGTSVIPDGQMIEVDGNAGRVRLL